MTKEQLKIPTSKIQRAASFAGAGAKVGGNYIKYYVKKALNPDLNRDELNEDNAEDIYGTLSKLKGSALKVAQMLSMDKNLMPQAYQDKFQMAQYSAPPLSYPLVVKTFNQEFKKSPTEMFDTFTKVAIQAASIGQVHRAEINGHAYAVKVQYPGVAASVSSDLKLVKPLATRILNLKGKDIGRYFKEVKDELEAENKAKDQEAFDLAIKQMKQLKDDGIIKASTSTAVSSEKTVNVDKIDKLQTLELTTLNVEAEYELTKTTETSSLVDEYNAFLKGVENPSSVGVDVDAVDALAQNEVVVKKAGLLSKLMFWKKK